MDRPVILAPSDPSWPDAYTLEAALIRSALSDWLPGLEHIGSTSVPNLCAKPTIDILGGLRHLEDATHILEPLAGLGYIYIPEYEDTLPERRYFDKNRTSEDGFHLHVVEIDSYFWRRHIAFRDYLRSHPEAVREYDELKTRLARECGPDREKYTDSKTEFVQRIERLAGVNA